MPNSSRRNGRRAAACRVTLTDCARSHGRRTGRAAAAGCAAGPDRAWPGCVAESDMVGAAVATDHLAIAAQRAQLGQPRGMPEAPWRRRSSC